MKKKTIVSMVLWVFGVSMVSAQSPFPEQRPLDLRVTGAFLSTDQQKRDDIVTVDVSVQGKPMWLRIGKVEDLTTQERAQAVKGEVLFRFGDKFDALYAIRYGSCKTVVLAKGGHDQIAGFYMVGEVVGMDGIASELHECEAIALEDMEAFRLPFDEVENRARLSHEFGHGLHKLLSHECGRAYTVMLMLGTMCAEQRVAFFLLDLSQRYKAHGYSSSEFVLRMTRKEIGSYLGLKLETVSRILSQFQRAGMLQVEGRNVKLRDRAAVSQLIESV
jgi:CRP/FNR family transcriptional regulator